MQILLVILLMLALFAPADAQTVPPPRPTTAAPLSALQPLRAQPALRGLPPSGTLSGLKSVGDATPQCRATCARDRYTCGGTDDDSCAQRWNQCVNTCG